MLTTIYFGECNSKAEHIYPFTLYRLELGMQMRNLLPGIAVPLPTLPINTDMHRDVVVIVSSFAIFELGLFLMTSRPRCFYYLSQVVVVLSVRTEGTNIDTCPCLFSCTKWTMQFLSKGLEISTSQTEGLAFVLTVILHVVVYISRRSILFCELFHYSFTKKMVKYDVKASVASIVVYPFHLWTKTHYLYLFQFFTSIVAAHCESPNNCVFPDFVSVSLMRI